MGTITPRRLVLILRVVLGLAILVVVVGIGIFAEYIGHPDLYPSRKRPIGSRPHWAFDLAFATVLIGLLVLIPGRRKKRPEDA